MLSRIHAPSRHTPSPQSTGSACIVSSWPPRRTCSSSVSPAPCCSSSCSCSVLRSSDPAALTMTSPSFSPQLFAGDFSPLSPVTADRSTTSTPLEKSLMPTALPSGITCFSPSAAQAGARLRDSASKIARKNAAGRRPRGLVFASYIRSPLMRVVAGDKFTLCKNARFMSAKIRMRWLTRAKRAKMPQSAR